MRARLEKLLGRKQKPAKEAVTERTVRNESLVSGIARHLDSLPPLGPAERPTPPTGGSFVKPGPAPRDVSVRIEVEQSGTELTCPPLMAVAFAFFVAVASVYSFRTALTNLEAQRVTAAAVQALAATIERRAGER